MTVGALLAGRYRVLASVGRGAIAEVVRARDERTGAEVALKILYPHLRESAAVVERFRREVDIVRKISHPNVLAIHEVIDADGQLFLVMNYHPGGDLADRLAAKRAFSADDVRDLAAQLCGALAAAHRAGVVHRDVKPSNVLCGPGPRLDVRLCDFGLARTADLSGLTTANAVLGTPEYMAPEVVVDGHADPRSDIYSLGVMLFEAATGRLPFYGDSPYQLMRQHVDSEARRARSLAPDLPPAIDATIARALAKDPLDRFATAEDLARALADEAPASSSDALVPAAAPEARTPARRACPKCGGWLVEAAAACADCGTALLRIDHKDGGVSVLVIGPGVPGDKIDAVKHVALYRLLDELPPGSVAIEKGKRRAPRVPFYVARNVTEATAKRLIARLEAAGFDAVMRSGWALSSPGMRKKLWTMTARQTAGAGLVVYMGPNLLPAIVGPSMIPYAMFWWIPLVLACWAGSFAWAVSHCRRALIGAGPSVRQDDRPRRLVDLLPRLSSRQDRRLVAHILERVAKIEALGRGEAAGAVVERAVLAADGLAALGQRRRFDASVPADREAALEELRREEKAGVVFRGELLRVASRLDDLCLLVARAKSAATPDEIARLGGEIEDLGRAVDAEQEVVALLGERR
ncbi:MAG TPA: serine/threonine-protein kinase [Polyangia bacterium]